VRILKCSIVVVLVIVTAGAGCSRHAPAARKHMQSLLPAELTWGEAAEGLQCRLRPTKSVYPTGENPTFNIALRNQGKRIFAFQSGGQAPIHRFSVDGRWRRRPGSPPKDGKILALGPGVEVPDMLVTLPEDAHPLLTPGRHVVRVAFSLEGIEVVSNPVEIEMVGPR